MTLRGFGSAIGALLVLLIFALLGVPQPTGAAPVAPNSESEFAEEPILTHGRFGVRPILDCVEPVSGGVRAYFGYKNPNSNAVQIPVGIHNFFVPAPIDRGQPERFQPGEYHYVFSAVFTFPLGAWVLTTPGSGETLSTTDSASTAGCATATRTPTVTRTATRTRTPTRTPTITRTPTGTRTPIIPTSTRTSTATPSSTPNPAPALTSLSPNPVTARSGAFFLTVRGTGFVPDSTVRWNGDDRQTYYGSATELVAAISADDINSAGSASITVVNAPPGGGVSNALTLTINPQPPTATATASPSATRTPTVGPNPAPVINGLVPPDAAAGSDDLFLTVNGSGFMSGAVGSVVHWNGSPRSTFFKDSGQVLAAISQADLANAGSASVTVVNPAPGGGTSNAISFAIVSPTPTATATSTPANPVPALLSLSPSSAAAGSPSFFLTVQGMNFLPGPNGSQLFWNGQPRTTFVNGANLLAAAIPASDVATAGTAAVTVRNPAPGGGTSNALTFSIDAATPTPTSTATVTPSPTSTPTTNPAPLLSSIVPPTTTVGSNALLLTLGGGNFITSSTVLVNGTPRLTVFQSAAQLLAALPTSDLAAASVLTVAVQNPTPGGGISASLPFTIVAAPVTPTPTPQPTLTPLIALLSPAEVVAGAQTFVLDVDGINFLPGAVVQWNGSALLSVFVDDGHLRAIVDSSRIAAVGVVSVTVLNPNGRLSDVQPFTIKAPTPPSGPAITALDPGGARPGGPSFILSIDGKNFEPGALARWNGIDLVTIWEDSTSLSAAIDASLIITNGTFPITVRNPDGALSNAFPFVVSAIGPLGEPEIVLIDPIQVAAGHSAFVLTVIGLRFDQTSAIQWNGEDLTTMFVDGQTLQAVIEASHVLTAGIATITVAQPDGRTSNGMPFLISSAPVDPPVLTIVTPAAAPIGSSAQVVRLTGSNFQTGAAVLFDGHERFTSVISPTEIEVLLESDDLATFGQFPLVVQNPDGGRSKARDFIIFIPGEPRFVPMIASDQGLDDPLDPDS
ncbi:MAG: hypothetical protein U0556_17665 [Dehalococcoidia bacterium]